MVEMMSIVIDRFEEKMFESEKIAVKYAKERTKAIKGRVRVFGADRKLIYAHGDEIRRYKIGKKSMHY